MKQHAASQDFRLPCSDIISSSDQHCSQLLADWTCQVLEALEDPDSNVLTYNPYVRIETDYQIDERGLEN